MTISAPTAKHAPLGRSSGDVFHSDPAILIYVALATVVLHLIVGNRYGIHRDELATLDDARHLAWGYVGVSARHTLLRPNLAGSFLARPSAAFASSRT